MIESTTRVYRRYNKGLNASAFFEFFSGDDIPFDSMKYNIPARASLNEEHLYK